MTERVNCPICKADSAVQVRSAADIVKCVFCSTVYLRTRPTVNELEKHYQMYADNPGSHMRLPDSIALAKQSGLRRDYFMNELLTFVGDKREFILDIGCGWGAFLDNALDKGFKPVGVEICNTMACYSILLLHIHVHRKQLEDCNLSPESFQVVTAIHSLEHLPVQYRALQYIHGILEPGGLFCGIVPNFDSYSSSLLKDGWPWLDPSMHYVHFTIASLRSALERFGFEVVRLYTATGDFDPKIIPNVSTPEEIKVLEATEQGEEIRFFAVKP